MRELFNDVKWLSKCEPLSPLCVEPRATLVVRGYPIKLGL